MYIMHLKALSVVVIACTLAPHCAVGIPTGRMMGRPPPVLPSISAAPVAVPNIADPPASGPGMAVAPAQAPGAEPGADEPATGPITAEELASAPATSVVEAVALTTPPAPPPAPSQCACNSSSYQEIRSVNVTFTNTTGGPALLRQATNTSWTILYIVPTLTLPNNTADFVFFETRITFSHPVQYINSAQIRFYTNALTSVLSSLAPELADVTAPTCTGGFVEPAPPFSPESDATITGVYETPDCRTLYMRGYAPLLAPLATNATQLEVDISASSLVDACGERFPGVSITTNIPSMQVAELYALGLAYTPRIGPATDRSSIQLAAVFTQPVPSLNATWFSVAGPKHFGISHPRLVAGSQSYYGFTVTVSDGYYGIVNVTMTQAAVQQVLTTNSTRPFVSFQKLAVQC